MIAGDREERLNVLRELVKWARIEHEAAERHEHSVAREARKRMRELVSLLGFDPLEYDCGRDGAALLLSRRSREILKHLPGSSREIAKATGVPPQNLHAYLREYITRGEVACSKQGTVTYWEVLP